MKCLTSDIPRVHHYERPAKCAACPVFLAGDVDCFKGVDETLSDVRYEIQVEKAEIVVKAGFCFDGASIPQMAWSSIGHPFTPEFVRAALVHDVVYHTGLLTRSQADEMLLELLEADGVDWWKRRAMYRAVWLCGGSRWRGISDEVRRHFGRYVTIEIRNSQIENGAR